MPRTRPFSELADKIKADPTRRDRIAELKREMEEILAREEQRTQPPEDDYHPTTSNGEPRPAEL